MLFSLANSTRGDTRPAPGAVPRPEAASPPNRPRPGARRKQAEAGARVPRPLTGRTPDRRPFIWITVRRRET